MSAAAMAATIRVGGVSADACTSTEPRAIPSKASGHRRRRLSRFVQGAFLPAERLRRRERQFDCSIPRVVSSRSQAGPAAHAVQPLTAVLFDVDGTLVDSN